MTHELKTIAPFFEDVANNKKKFEIRDNSNRNFQVGDELVLREFNPIGILYTGRYCVRHVTYVLQGGQFGIERGFVVMGISDSTGY